MCFYLSAILLGCGLSFSGRAASVIVPGFSTSQSSATLAELTSSTTRTINLNDRTGLAVGKPIAIRVTATDPTSWGGIFNYSPGPVVLDVTATLGVFVGQDGVSASFSLLHFDFVAPNDGVVSDVGGFNLGPSFGVLELVVPWETDLSAVQLVLSQNATATNGGFRESNVFTSVAASSTAQNIAALPLQIEVVSVPEPSAMLLVLPATALLGCFRRRAGAGVSRHPA
ncbi:MAG: hypothetical protein ACR2OZ_12585 [Verrucomicrobiales bacterium]